MASSMSWSTPLTIAAVFVLCLCQQAIAQGFQVPYCSTFNTANAGTRNASIYQSNSLCSQYCNGETDLNSTPYAFGVVQWQTCWCSDYAPSSTTQGCDLDCPGWQPEKCGSTSPSLYGYIQLLAAASGTQGPSAASTSSTSQETRSTSTTRRPTSSTSSSSTWTPTPTLSLETLVGSIRTVTVMPTAPPNAEATNAVLPSSGGGGGGLGTGGAVGLTVGLVALVAIVAAAVFFFLRKRRRDQEAADNVSRRGSSAGFGAAVVPSRTMSENSRYVLGTDGRRVVETWEPGETAEVRRSRLIPVDQRLDPFSPVYQRGDNKSRESVNTIRDDHDYSRRMVTGGNGILRATNPD